MAQNTVTRIKLPVRARVTVISRKRYGFARTADWELYGFMNSTLVFISLIVDCFFLYLVFLAIRGIVRFFSRLFSSDKTTFQTLAIPVPTPYKAQEEIYPYQREENLLTPTELKFYQVLKPICDEGSLTIFSKVRLEDLVYVSHSVFEQWRWRGYIRSRHIDFVLCDKNSTKILCAVELDDWHHGSFRAQEIDERKDKICKDAGLPLIRVKVKNYYDPLTLKETLQQKIQKST
jgi:hypothetical protein